MKIIDIKESQKISYCISASLRDEQIRINLKKVSGRLEPNSELRNEPIAIVAFAPSLNETWEELKKFKYIMTCSGAHKFLVEKGITPTWHVDLDPREHKVKILGQPQEQTEYLIASTIHPNYLDALKGYNVKLWHIFANEDEGAAVLPRGEWLVTGGSSVGLRCMTLSRLLGFTDLHIFGMDGNIRESGSHTTAHPNAPKENFKTEYEGVKYLTTPSILFCAKETFKELDQMADVKATFYGDGLVQHMSKKYVPNVIRQTDIAFNKPELISQEYIELNKKLHETNPTYGMGGAKHKETIIKLAKQLNTTSILDYGCGKGMLAKELDFPIWQYDPAIPEYSSTPKPADIVVCTDVLEHIEPDKLQFVLSELKRCTKQVGYLVISTRKAVKTYANGANTHSIVQGKEWWEKKLSKYFDIGTIIEKQQECELHIVVAPKKVVQPDITTVEKNGVKVSFYTPNDTTKWRAETLFTKEPSTIEWIEQMKEGEVMYDIGANIGSYSVLAGKKGVKVFSFEPEAENYSLLVKNLQLNNIEPNAYCLAISDEEKAGTLYAGQQGVGGACHSFNEKVGYDLKEKNFGFSQGCFGVPLDKLIEDGLPHPQHLKIDVDGFEYKVIKGAEKILSNGIKSVLIEVNTNLQQHIDMVEHLCKMGFEFDEQQVERAKRKEGTFKGVAEYIFTKKKKDKKTLSRVARKINDTPLVNDPFDYLYIENVFPKGTYDKILKSIKEIKYEPIEKTRGTKGYPKRFTGTTPEFLKELLDGEIKKAILNKFGIADDSFIQDLLLIKDYEGYQIPPHTDSTKKVISALFYLPEDSSIEHEGTAIYVPKEKGFTCNVGVHHNFDDFEKVWTAPFKPNSCLIFARTENSFHGVEITDSSIERNVLLYNINKK